MKLALALVLLSARLAVADDMTEHTRRAHDAAEHGFCDAVKETADTVRQLDPAYYEASFATDASIAACLAPEPEPEPAPAPPPPPAPQPAAQVVPARGDRGIPPLSTARIVGEISGGIVGGYVALYIGLVGALSICSDDNDPCWLGLIGGAGIVGMSAGVWAVGGLGSQGGSFAKTLLGGVAGAVTGAVIELAGTSVKSDFPQLYTTVGLAFAGALVGFNLSRHYDKVDVGVAPTAGGAALTLSTAW